MFRATKVLLALVAAHSAVESAVFAGDCACPPSCVAPSCAVPSDCFYTPSCAAPGSYESGCRSCRSGYSDGGGAACCKPDKGKWIHIDLSRTINKGNKIKKNSGGFMGEAPPVGASVVMSSPVMFTNMAAIPVNFQAGTNDNSAAIAAAVAAVMSQQQKATAAAAAASDSNSDVKQLQSDVQQLKQITVNLTNVVEELAKNHPKPQ